MQSRGLRQNKQRGRVSSSGNEVIVGWASFRLSSLSGHVDCEDMEES
jgi:hypothetical protein